MYRGYTVDPYQGGQPSWFSQGSAAAPYRQPESWQGQQQQQPQQQQQGRAWQQQGPQYQQPSQQYPQQTYPQQQQYQQQAYKPQQHQQQKHQTQQYHRQPQYTQPQQFTSSAPKAAAASPGRAAGRPHKRQRAEQQEQQQARLPHAPRQQQQQSADTEWLDVLQQEVMQFAQEAAPSEIEEAARKTQLSILEGAVHAAVGRGVKVMLFGSARAGLALHSSDLDVMITGLFSPDGDNGGYSKYGKQQVVKYLRAVEREARKHLQISSCKLIPHARIPLLKLETSSGTELDVSINDAGGVSAANFLQSWQQDFKVLRPLVLVLKSILKQNSLGDVSIGGLGSWSLANMVIAHLMAEDAAGGQVDHAGHMLFSFLKRFGVDWNINSQAVAVAQGGIVSRLSLRTAAGPFAGPDKLAVKDPLTGREVAGGSHRYADVARLWGELYEDMNERGPVAAAKATRGSSNKVLDVVLDCDRAVRRPGTQQDNSKAGLGYERNGYTKNAYDKWQGDSRKRSR